MTSELVAAAHDAASFFVNEFTHGMPSPCWLEQAFLWHSDERNEGAQQAFASHALRLIRAMQGCVQ